MVDKEQVAGLMAAGVGVTEIALAVGCDPSYVTQLRDDPEVNRMVGEQKAATSVQDAKFDTILNDTELNALEAVKLKLPFANFSQSLAALRTLNAARRRKDGPETGAQTNIHVTLTLPTAHLPKYVTSQSNEIIEVEGRTMLSATPKSLDALLLAREGKPLPARAEAQEKAAKLLGSLSPRPRREPRAIPASLKEQEPAINIEEL